MIGERIAVGAADRGDLPGENAGAVVGEGRVGAGHLDGSGVVGSQCDGGRAFGLDDARIRASAATLS